MYYFKRIAVFAATYILNLNLLASTEADLDKIVDLRPYTITGSIGNKHIEDSIIPITELSGDELDRALALTLGETLDGLAGIHSTAFASGASRPIIRGFDGPRVQVLEDGTGTADVSASSPDHAVTVIPSFAEYIDVVRGPASLLYGSSAIGGVVNVIGSRYPVRRNSPLFQGELDFSYDSVSSGWDTSAVATITQPGWAIRINAIRVDHGDYDIPGFADSAYAREAFHDDDDHDDAEEEHEEEHERDTLANSFVNTESGNVGLSLFPTEKSRLSIALFTQQSEYGVPGHEHHHEEGHDEHEDHHDEGDEEHDEDHEAEDHDHEEGVYVDLDQYKLDLDGEVELDGGFLETLKFRFLYADYEHKEIEGDEIGTQFKRDSWESRLESLHRWNETMTGVWGLQLSNSEYESAGEEAINPDSETRNLALFALEEWETENAVYNMAARMERRDLQAEKKEGYDDWGTGFSVGAKFEMSERLSLNTSISRSERHPTVTELYADGAHIATRQYEIGDATLGKETSWSIDSGLSWNSEKWTTRVNVFGNTFSNYIFAAPTNRSEDGLQVFEFKAVDASFYGAELETEYTVFKRSEQQLTARGIFDLVKANIKNSEETLPRIPTARIGGTLLYKYKNMSAFGNLRYSFKTSDVADNEFPTDDYWQLDLGIEYTAYLESMPMTFYIKGKNMLDEEIRKHTSFLKDVAPLPGRNIVLGCRIAY